MVSVMNTYIQGIRELHSKRMGQQTGGGGSAKAEALSAPLAVHHADAPYVASLQVWFSAQPQIRHMLSR